MIEGIIIAILFVLAIGYVGRSLYKSYQGDAGCASHCCDTPVKSSKVKVVESK
ncbi:MAG TPA: FeoB-associated Cys-rich membrane protein [Fulvivirga sp.]|nr:FeoB-associated Cys-rich membrane protein [Fulvivirga sp.]